MKKVQERKKSADAWARKKSENLSQEGEKRGRLVGKRMDALSLCSRGDALFFFGREAPLLSPQKSKTSLSTTSLNNKNYGRFESQRYARDARARHARDVLDREMRSIAPSSFVVAELVSSRSNAKTFLKKNSIKSLSLSLFLSLFCFSKNIFLCCSRFLNLDARARGFTPQHLLTHSRVFFLSTKHSFGARNSGFGHAEHEILRGESGNTRPGEQRCASSKTKNGDEGSVRPPHQLFGRV